MTRQAVATAVTPPFLSLHDPVLEEEGSIDPLSLQPTYERLAERILPYITVRMARPRFLTAIAVGARVAADVRTEVGKDGVTPPWLVFEWHVAEAHVRQNRQEPAGRFPGVQKVGDALAQRRPLSASTYLKTPKVFGYTGVYRRLAEGLQITSGEDLELDDGGFELLRIWERESDLDGFLDGRDGGGAHLRGHLREAVDAGLRCGHTAKHPRWLGWEPLADRLHPSEAGKQERRWLYERLLRTDLRPHPEDPEALEMRSEFLAALRQHGHSVTREDEADYFRGLIRRCSRPLKQRIQAIDAYEGTCRLLDDGFRLILGISARTGDARVQRDEYTRDTTARRIAKRLGQALERLATEEAPATAAQALTSRYESVRDPGQLFDAVVDHHETAQREKPPDGKRPWVERSRPDEVYVRPQYRQVFHPDTRAPYVHNYRTSTCSRFLRDLGRLGW